MYFMSFEIILNFQIKKLKILTNNMLIITTKTWSEGNCKQRCGKGILEQITFILIGRRNIIGLIKTTNLIKAIKINMSDKPVLKIKSRDGIIIVC